MIDGRMRPKTLTVLGFLLLFISATIAQAQQKAVFKGIVMDARDGTTLIGANIKLRKDFSTGTITDQEGRFYMQLDPGTYTFIISFIGMASDTVTFTMKAGEIIERQFPFSRYGRNWEKWK